MWTPPLPSPLPLPHPGPASSTRSDGSFPLVGYPDGYARATPPHRWHPLHVARRHHAIPAQGLLMFLGRRVYMHTYIIRIGGGGVYAEHLLYIIMTLFRKRSFRILYPSSVPTRPSIPAPHPPQVNNINTDTARRTDTQVFKKVTNMHSRIGKIIYCRGTLALNSTVNDVHPLYRFNVLEVCVTRKACNILEIYTILISISRSRKCYKYIHVICVQDNISAKAK